MLIGWSQAFPQRDVVVSENEAMKDADIKKERQDVILNVSTTSVCCRCTVNSLKMSNSTFPSPVTC